MNRSKRMTTNAFVVGVLCGIGVLCAAAPPVRAAVCAEQTQEQIRLQSKSSGRSYDITIYSGCRAKASAVQRVIYVLNGEASAALLAATQSQAPTLVVALKAAGETAFTQYDFTPTSRRLQPNTPGGAEDFLRFVIEELQPAIAPRVSAHADRVVVGSQQAGLWVLYGLINEPSAFDGYVAVDPTLDWDDALILNSNMIGRLGPKLATQRRAARVALAPRPQPSASFAKMVDTLGQTPGVTVRVDSSTEEHGEAERIARAIEQTFALKSQARPASPRPAISQANGLAIPGAQEYLQLTPQQRYDLRSKVRALPVEQREVWNRQFKYNLDAGLWYDAHRALHDERVRMDKENGVAPNASAPPAARSFTVAGAQVRVMQSTAGRAYRIYVWEPSQQAPAGGRPVIYVLDGETTFMLVRDIARNLADAYPGADLPMIVALAYDIAEPYSPAGLKATSIGRTYDYTPAVASEKLGASFDDQPWAPTGGAAAFLQFIERELKPAIETDFSIDRRRQTLMGHSFGGLFTLNTFFSCPDCFSTYVASSPSLWYGSRYIEQVQEQFVAARAASLAGKRLLLTVGSLEQSRAPQRGERGRAEWLEHSRMVDGNRELAASLQPLRNLGLDLQFRLFEGESHLSVKPVAANYGVRFAMRPDAAVDPSAVVARRATNHAAYEVPLSEQWNEAAESGVHPVAALFPAFPASQQAPANGYPVVYFLGAQRNFGVVADTLRRLEGGGMLEPALAIGIDSPELLGTISQRVAIRLRPRYAIDESRRVLIGYGDDAAAVLRNLSTQPDSFDAYVVLSPPATAVEQIKSFAILPGASSGKRLFLAAGDAAADDFPGALQGTDDVRIPDALLGLNERLQAARSPGLETQLRIFAAEDNTFSTVAIAEALLFELDKSNVRSARPGAAISSSLHPE